MAGDWLHWQSLAYFPAGNKDTAGEIDAIEEHIEPFLRAFDHIYYIAGNHDTRPSLIMDRMLGLDKMSRLVVKPELALEFSQKVQISDYYYMWVGTGENRWRIVHPKATNTVPANAAKALAIKFNCNVAQAHDHLLGIQQTPDGRHLGMEIGCCVDPERLDYYMKRDMTRPKMMNGALLLEKGSEGFYPTLLTEQWTDWGRFEKENRSTRAARRESRR